MVSSDDGAFQSSPLDGIVLTRVTHVDAVADIADRLDRGVCR